MILTETDALWIEYPPFPSIVTVYVPGEPVQERVDVSDPPFARLFEEKEHVILDEDGVAVSLTVATKPFERMRPIVEVPVALPTISTVVGLALKSKSGRIAVPQMLLSIMPIANFSVVSPANPVVTYWNEISMNTPDCWSKAKPEDEDRLYPCPEKDDEKFRKFTGLNVPNTISLLVELNIGAVGLFQMWSVTMRFPARTK